MLLMTLLLLLLLLLPNWLLTALAAVAMVGCWSWRRGVTLGQGHTGTSPSSVLPVQPVLFTDLGAEGFRRFASGAAAESRDAAAAQPGRTNAHGASPLERARPAPSVRLHESQNGFRPERSCADHQFTLHQVLSGRRAEGKESYVLFVDVSKAFPTVWLDGLWHKLWNKGIQGKCFRVLHGLYQGAKRVVT